MSPKQQLFSDCNGKYILYSVPWDTKCEQVRWSLDRHNGSYTDVDLPFGLHLWETCELDAKSTNVPILVNEKNEVFDSVTKITMFLYSQAFSGRIRLYSSMEALQLQEDFDKGFAEATRLIYLSELWQSKKLTTQFLLEANHLRTWISINKVAWKYFRFGFYFYFKLGDKAAIASAWDKIHETFERVKEIKSRNLGNKFLIGTEISAADISFASHAALILLPDQKLSMKLPSSSDMSKCFQEKSSALKESIAGKFAIDMYKNERKLKPFNKLSSKLPQNNPKWADSAVLSVLVTNLMFQLLIPTVVPFMVGLDWGVTIVYWTALIIVAYLSGYFQNSKVAFEKFKKIKALLT